MTVQIQEVALNSTNQANLNPQAPEEIKSLGAVFADLIKQVVSQSSGQGILDSISGPEAMPEPARIELEAEEAADASAEELDSEEALEEADAAQESEEEEGSDEEADKESASAADGVQDALMEDLQNMRTDAAEVGTEEASTAAMTISQQVSGEAAVENAVETAQQTVAQQEAPLESQEFTQQQVTAKDRFINPNQIDEKAGKTAVETVLNKPDISLMPQGAESAVTQANQEALRGAAMLTGREGNVSAQQGVSWIPAAAGIATLQAGAVEASSSSNTGQSGLDVSAKQGTLLDSSKKGDAQSAGNTKDASAAQKMPRPAQAQMIERIHQIITHASKTRDTSTIVLRLDPPEFGRLTVKLSQRSDELFARIIPENPEVEAILKARSQELTSALTSVGLKGENIHVSIGSEQSGWDAFQFQQSLKEQYNQKQNQLGAEQGEGADESLDALNTQAQSIASLREPGWIA